jgi:hypothetical protein
MNISEVGAGVFACAPVDLLIKDAFMIFSDLILW